MRLFRRFRRNRYESVFRKSDFGADENGLFCLEADVTINGTSQKSYIEGNLQTDTYQIQLGDVFACLKGDRLYLNYGNLKILYYRRLMD